MRALDDPRKRARGTCEQPGEPVDRILSTTNTDDMVIGFRCQRAPEHSLRAVRRLGIVNDVSQVNPYAGLPGFWNRVNRALYPVLGPAQITPMGVQAPTPAAMCPVCRRAISEHRFDRKDRSRPTIMVCPD